MARPVGSGGNLHERRAEWSLVRKTAALGDVVDEATFIAMLGVTKRAFRQYSSDGAAFGVPFPTPIARPEGSKPIWLRDEAEKFQRTFYGARNARRRS